MPSEFSVVGKRVPRKDALEKVTGKAMYTSDLQLPGMLYAKFLRSPHAHARIININPSKAEALSGVRAVLTCKNVPKRHLPSKAGVNKFEYILDEVVHYSGEEVAAVAGVNKEIAEKALNFIEIQYEVLQAVFDKEEAMECDAPLVHPEIGSNLYQCARTVNGALTLDYGDVNKGFAEADYIIQGIYESPFQHPASPEPRSVLCQWVGDCLICWSSTQLPRHVEKELSICLEIPVSRVRVISDYSVGGYGGKDPEKTAVLTALLAKVTNRPVKAVFTRGEDFVATHRRIDAKINARIGVKKDATITAIHCKQITNFGRDSSLGYLIPATSAVNTCSALYRYQNSKWEGYHVITNIEDHGSMMAFGDPEATFCIERIMDEIAEKLGMNPVEFRLKNCARYGDKGMYNFRVVRGPVEWGILGPDMDSFPECIRKVAEKSDFMKKWKGWKTPTEAKNTKRRGIGIAIGMHHCMAFPPDSAILKMNQDGTADVLTSGPEIGQGLKTAISQVVAEVLGLKCEDVYVILGDTRATPYGPGVFASRGILGSVGSAYRAALDVKRQLFEIASKKLGVDADELEIRERMICVRERPNERISIAETCLAGYQVASNIVLPYPWIDERLGKEIAPMSCVATVAEVEVDIETGELNVLRLTSAHDCGRVINPTIAENQINTALTMGNGWVRSEGLVIDGRDGAILNCNLLDYKIMTILDMPKMGEINEILVEFPNPWGPFGAKGMSETAMVTTAPAIANAIYNAIGVRIRGDRLTPDRILQALEGE